MTKSKPKKKNIGKKNKKVNLEFNVPWPKILPPLKEAKQFIAKMRFPGDKKKQEAFLKEKNANIKSDEIYPLVSIKQKQDILNRIDYLEERWKEIEKNPNDPRIKYADKALSLIKIIDNKNQSGMADWTHEVMQLEKLGSNANMEYIIPFAEIGKKTKAFNSNAGKCKKGKFGHLKHAIIQITKKIKARDREVILKLFKDDANDACEILEELRGVRRDAIRIKIQEVNFEKKKIYLIADGKEEIRTFKTIENILSQIKK